MALTPAGLAEAPTAAKKTATPAPTPTATGPAAGKTTKSGAPRKPRGSVVRPALDPGEIKITAAEDPELFRRHRRTKGPRDPEQVFVDKIVTAAHDRWVAAGRPEEWLDYKGLQLRVPSDKYETLVWRINRSGDHLGVAIRLGSVVHADGYAVNVLVVKDRTVKEGEGDNDGGSGGGDSGNRGGEREGTRT
jgi:hypothetical protein